MSAPSTQNATTALPEGDPKFIGSLDVTYGQLLINRGEAKDYATMRADQLSNLLLLIQADDCDGFNGLRPDSKSGLLWLAQQMADELRGLVDLVADDAARRRAK